MIGVAQAAEQTASGMPQFQTEYFSSQLIWAIISFVILFYLLKRFIFPVVNRLLDERAEHIRQELEAANALRKSAEDTVAKHHLMLKQLQQDADRIMLEVRKQSLLQRDEAIAQINAEHLKRKQELFAEISCARRQALKELRSISVDIAMAATEKVISEHVDRDETEKAVSACVEELTKNS